MIPFQRLQPAFCYSVVCVLQFIACAVGYCSAAQVVIHDNGSPDLRSGLASDFDFPFQAADDFSVSVESTIGRFRWWGVYGTSGRPGPAIRDQFTIRIFSQDNDVPDSAPQFEWPLIDAERQDTDADDQTGFDVYVYEAHIDHIVLPNGDYFFSVVNDTPSSADHWFWASSSQNTGSMYDRASDAASWNFRSKEMAFILLVPEPQAHIMCIALLALLGITEQRAHRTCRT